MTNLIVISSESNVEKETRIVNDLFHNGMRLFHLRKPGFTIDQQRTFLTQIEEQFHDKISVHQHYETVTEFSLKYFHVKEQFRTSDAGLDSASQFLNIHTNAETLKQVRGDTVKAASASRSQRSTSFHNFTDLQFENHKWDYSFLSPVFDSISKPGYKGAFANVKVESLSEQIFALGGVTQENIEQVFDKGFYGAAVLGAIWSKPEGAIKNFKELEIKCRQNVHMY